MKYLLLIIVFALALASLFPLWGYATTHGPEWMLIDNNLPLKGVVYTLGGLCSLLIFLSFIGWINSLFDGMYDEEEEDDTLTYNGKIVTVADVLAHVRGEKEIEWLEDECD